MSHQNAMKQNRSITPTEGPTSGRLPDVIDDAVPQPTKTPFFQAINAARYQRQAIIKKIEDRTGRKLICYVAGSYAPIHRDDTVGFVDLLHNVPKGGDLDLLLHTGGGDIDAAEKLISMVRTRVGNGVLRVVVPDFAKSAGTLMVLAADLVVMSRDTSELGPIDPQVTLVDGNGNRITHSIQNYLDAYEAHSKTLENDPNDIAARLMLTKLDPATIKLFEAVRDRALKFAESHLKLGMHRNGGNYTKTARDLLDTKRWQSHGQMISCDDAQTLGLSVECLDQASIKWQEYWQLYCLQRLAVIDRQKLFESDYASLVMDSAG